ncbi:hypothetical protein EYB45_02085 [Erythrobacteraceae bacterium CFH 75059]|uniref:hypothetical protein n=1 Tax=Qipengyuania thermophila TaxID=2509361 RepID=UPI00101E9732|nr:hypothetical protein [Qipengyuania thermophila]TCD06528.1 hypothetical protein EYB45_02085 [Erythrobacteraceae bacterium CFH 75059]
MQPRHALLALAPLALTLAACGEFENASAEAQADTVEIPADEPLANVAEEPVADPAAGTDVPAADVIASDAEGGAGTLGPDIADQAPPATPGASPAAPAGAAATPSPAAPATPR